ncbi:MAG: ABC transporter substrate-binding protein [Bacteroidales bacterium]|nr:ABC transporter substrate-binding protein [Bacteroidales bacterium]
MKKYLNLLFLLLIPCFHGIAQQMTFTPQWTAQSQFAGYYAALENGYYAEAGLDVSIEHPTPSYSSLNMLKDGTSDIITSELIQAMMAANENLRLVNLMQTTQHSTLVLVARAQNVKELADVAGCRIGTWKIGFSEIPHMIDEEQFLDIEWIKLTNPLNLYIAGAIDATLAKSYNELILFSMAGIKPGSILHFSECGYDFPEDGLYVTEEYYKKNKVQCHLFAEASRKGWEWVRNNRAEALDIVMKYVKEANVPTNRYNQKWMLEAILEAQEDVKGGEPSYRLDEDAFNQLNEALKKYGYIARSAIYERFTGENL